MLEIAEIETGRTRLLCAETSELTYYIGKKLIDFELNQPDGLVGILQTLKAGFTSYLKLSRHESEFRLPRSTAAASRNRTC
jgi:hypothetical protein